MIGRKIWMNEYLGNMNIYIHMSLYIVCQIKLCGSAHECLKCTESKTYPHEDVSHKIAFKIFFTVGR